MLARPLIACLAFASFGLARGQDVPVEKYRLPNGMTVILAPDHSLPLATINTWFSVGSKDEPDRRSGFAHLFEHLMFMGTNRVPNGQFDKIMEAAGGSNNASTAEDRTNYYSSGPSVLLPTFLWLDADRLQDLANSMTLEKVNLQREVVKNERRQNTENTPYGKAYEAINGLMFPAGHPYHTSVIGSMEDLTAASVQDVKDFFNTYYVPNNASLVVAGDFDPKAIKPLIDKYFSSLPRRNDPPRRDVPPVHFDTVKKVTMVDTVQFAKILNVYHSPANYQPGDVEMRLAGSILSNGLSSRLYDRLVVRDQLASDVSAYQDGRLLGSLFTIDATAAEGASLDKLQAAIDDEVAKFNRTGPTTAELDRIKAQTEYAFLHGLQSIGQKADQLNEYQFYRGDPNSFQWDLNRYRSATPASIRSVSSRVLNPKHRLILRVVPATEAPKQNPLDKQLDLTKAAGFTAPLPTSFKLSNGIQVQYWNRPQLPLMAVMMTFDTGADLDSDAKAGRSQMMASMLDEGSGKRSAKQFQDALDELGANFSASAGHRQTSTSISVISSKFGPAMELFADANLRPTFDGKEWDRLKRTTVSDLQQELDDPSSVARQVAAREYFGWSHPFGRPTTGTAHTVSGLALQDLKTAYSQIIRPSGARIFVAGSLPQAAIRQTLESAFGKWRASGTQTLATTPAPAPSAFRVVVVDRPGAVQTVIRFMLPGIKYSDPARLTYEALGTVLGGSFTSRLNQNLREAKGYTYGAGASFVFDRYLGYFVASAAVRADVTGASIDEFLKELRAIQGGNVTDVEATKAASIETDGVIESMADLSSIVGLAAALNAQGRPFSDINAELAEFAKIRASAINEAAPRAIDLDHGVLVLVGDKATILSQLEGKGLPTPVIVRPTP